MLVLRCRLPYFTLCSSAAMFNAFQVSKLGFGCMGLTGMYNDPVPEQVGISIIKHAFDRGVTFFDTSDIYGNHANEALVGKLYIFFKTKIVHNGIEALELLDDIVL